MRARWRWLLPASLVLVAGALALAGWGGLRFWQVAREVEPGVGHALLAREHPVPSALYARPLLLEAGHSLERRGVALRLAAAGYRRVDEGEPTVGEFLVGEQRWVVARRRFLHADGWDDAGRFTLELDGRGAVAAILGEDGERLSQLRLDPPLIGHLHGKAGALREPVPLAELPPALVQAFLAIEDRRFHEHRGLDPWRVVGAALANLRAGRIVQGGSTITQQLVRAVYLTRERVLSRKLREAALALAVERELDKDQILGLYLDEIYLGQDGALAVHGVGAAARHYFSEDVRDLELHQLALLAALARGPSRYSPLRHPEDARARRDLVLRSMVEAGFLEAAEAELAAAQPLDVRPEVPRVRSLGFFVEWVRRALADELGEGRLEGEALRIHTTLDWRLQHLGEEALAAGLADLEERAPKLLQRDPPVEGALLALEPQSGDVLAMVGGRDFGRSQFNRTTQARRQPGSVFKTVVALAALDPATSITLASTIRDAPILVPAPEPLPGEEPEEPEEDWEPLNHDEEFRGRVTLRQALEESLNVPMVVLGQEVGLERVVETARRLGIRGRLRPVPSLALGTFEVSLLSMTRAYGVLAAGGVRSVPRTWTAVTTAEGEAVAGQRLRRERVVDPDSVFLVTSALEGAVDRGTGRSVRALGYRGPLAGKTGSSDGYRDGWFLGYTPELAAGVWVGFDDEESLGLPGAYTALPVFTRFLSAALGPRGGAAFEPPAGVRRETVMARLGTPEDGGCREVSDWFVAGTAPRWGCGGFWGLESRPAVSSGPPGFRWPWERP